MQIIFLNVWHGKTEKILEKFLKDLIPTTDIFCLQEVDTPLVNNLIKKTLSGFSITKLEKNIDMQAGGEVKGIIATCIKNSKLKLLEHKPILQDNALTGVGLYTKIKYKKHILHLGNIHGVYKPGDKLDTPIRIQQSCDIVDFFNSFNNFKIIGGDFNLMSNTKSIKLFEKAGYVNLIKRFNIKNTRNRLAWEQFPKKQLWADYIFVDKNTKIKNFKTLNNEVSDHLPLILNIEL